MRALKIINMTRPVALYLTFVGVLLFLVFADARVSVLIQAFIPHLMYQQYVATGVLAASVGMGLLGAQRHGARVAEPWRVPQSQVMLCFILFFILGVLTVLISS